MGQKWYVCSSRGCPFKTRLNSKFESHRLTCEKAHEIRDNWHRCHLCEYKTRTNVTLTRHKKSIHGAVAEWRHCEFCNYKAKKAITLTRHKSFKHDIDVVWYYCDKCDYKAKASGNLKRHKQDRHYEGVIWSPCSLCDYRAKRASDLGHHMRYWHGHVDKKESPRNTVAEASASSSASFIAPIIDEALKRLRCWAYQQYEWIKLQPRHCGCLVPAGMETKGTISLQTGWN